MNDNLLTNLIGLPSEMSQLEHIYLQGNPLNSLKGVGLEYLPIVIEDLGDISQYNFSEEEQKLLTSKKYPLIYEYFENFI